MWIDVAGGTCQLTLRSPCGKVLVAPGGTTSALSGWRVDRHRRWNVSAHNRETFPRADRGPRHSWCAAKRSTCARRPVTEQRKDRHCNLTGGSSLAGAVATRLNTVVGSAHCVGGRRPFCGAHGAPTEVGPGGGSRLRSPRPCAPRSGVDAAMSVPIVAAQ